MTTLDQMLSRLPRKAPDSNFVNKLCQRIRCERVLASVPAQMAPYGLQFESMPIEPASPRPKVISKGESMEVPRYLYPSPVRQQPRPSKIATAWQSFLWATGGNEEAGIRFQEVGKGHA